MSAKQQGGSADGCGGELKRVRRAGTLEKIRSWIVDTRPPGSRVVLDGRYYVLAKDGEHLAAVGLKRLAWHSTELRHLVVPPGKRRKGYGRLTVDKALDKIATPLTVTTVRSDNISCLRIMFAAGFRLANVIPAPSGEVAYLVRENTNGGQDHD